MNSTCSRSPTRQQSHKETAKPQVQTHQYKIMRTLVNSSCSRSALGSKSPWSLSESWSSSASFLRLRQGWPCLTGFDQHDWTCRLPPMRRTPKRKVVDEGPGCEDTRLGMASLTPREHLEGTLGCPFNPIRKAVSEPYGKSAPASPGSKHAQLTPAVLVTCWRQVAPFRPLTFWGRGQGSPPPPWTGPAAPAAPTRPCAGSLHGGRGKTSLEQARQAGLEARAVWPH